MRFTKKLLASALVLMFVFALMPSAVFADDVIRVTIDGQHVHFSDAQPTTVDGRTLVPIRAVFEAVGFHVGWDIPTQTATLTRNDYIVVITIGSLTFTTNGVSHDLDVPAQLIGGSTMLPIRAVLESVGYEVDWNAATRTVLISSPQIVEQPITPSQLLTVTEQENQAAHRRIRSSLGVDFAIQPIEYIYAQGTGHIRWQRLDLHGDLDTARFTSHQENPEDHWYHRIFGAERGDVFIVSWWDSEHYYVIIGLGDGKYHWQYIGLYNPEPMESVDIAYYLWQVEAYYLWQVEFERRRVENETRFGMTLQYTSENFYWYSNDSNAQWLPIIAHDAEERMQEVFDMFGIAPSQRMYFWYYSLADYRARYVEEFGWNFPDGGWHAFGRVVIAASQRDMFGEHWLGVYVSVVVHEVVHILQWYLNDFRIPTHDWITEGTARYMQDGWQNWRTFYGDRIAPTVRANEIPTLDWLEDIDNFWSNPGLTYCLGASIIEFVHLTWGFDYVIELQIRPMLDSDYLELFGTSRAEFERQWHEWLRNIFV